MNATPVCAACKSPNLRAHCERRKTPCGWWRCRACGSFGNGTHHVNMGSKRR